MVLQNFIVFEGIDGAGTTTQLRRLKERDGTGNFLFTAEPTSCPTGTFLRTVLSGKVELTAETAAFLFAADRCEHIYGPLRTEGDRNLVTGVQGACENGLTVVSDRYLFSSLAYQSIGCGEALPALLNSTFPLPRLLFYFDIDPAVSLDRIRGRGTTEIYEKRDFLERTRSAYEQILERYDRTGGKDGMRIIRIDAEETPESIAEHIWHHIKTA